MKLKFRIFAISLILLSSVENIFAEDSSTENVLKKLEEKIRSLESVLENQERKISFLESNAKNVEVIANKSSKKNQLVNKETINSNIPPVVKSQFNPDIGIIADITAISSESQEDEEGNDKISLRELELIFGHDVDPYSRLDATITLSDFEEVGVEEAYITHWGLGDVALKLGRMKPKVGKSTSLHRDSLETVDQPFVVQQFLGVEGLSRSGVEFNYTLPFSFNSYVADLNIGIMEGGIGEGGNLFAENRRRPSYYSHLKNYWELSESNNLEVGGTFLTGSGDEDSGNEVKAYGLDLVYTNWITPIKRFKLQSEAYLQDRSVASGDDSIFDQTPYGIYALADYRFSERWGVGARYDYVQPVNLSENIETATKGYSTYLTFFQSEFARWRFQYQRAELLNGTSDDRFMLQATAAIGVHKHTLN